MMTMMQSCPNGMASDMNQMLPFFLLDEGETDMENLFLMTTMMQNNCEDTNSQMNMLLPLLLMSEDSEDAAISSTWFFNGIFSNVAIINDGFG